MPQQEFRVKPYTHLRYKFVVRAKVDGKWRRRYFESESEAQTYADERNKSALERSGNRRRHTSGRILRKKGSKSTLSPSQGRGKDKPRTAVVVLGMHRSGTSAFCGAIRLLGVNFGKEFLPANEWNKKGYWEHPEIVRLHNELLFSFDSNWFDNRPLPKGWESTDSAIRIQVSLRTILERDFKDAVLFGLKDPRMCRLMPIWFPIFDAMLIEPRFVVMLRHPWEIVQSLVTRDGLDEAHAYLLACNHIVDAEKATRLRTRTVVHYRVLLEDPASVLHDVAHELDLEIGDPGEKSRELNDFVQSSLRHHLAIKPKPPEWTRGIPEKIVETFEALEGVSTSGELGEKLAAFDQNPPGMATSSRSTLRAVSAPKMARYWAGPRKMHLPFVYHLVREVNPETFVELGVLNGESYFAVCQSVSENALVTKCYGIDTGSGDLKDPGLYGGPDEVDEVVNYNSRYSSFSQFVARPSNEAVTEFQDGSIGLLHIDGARRYQHVKKDFEMWRPKLSETGIILFYGVTDRDHGPSLYRFWQQIAGTRASFLFQFGQGLGVWRKTGASRNDVPFLRSLFLADSVEQQKINRYYAMLGSEVESMNQIPRTKPEGHRVPAVLQVFGPRDGTACAEYSATIEIVPGQWCGPRIELASGLGDGSGPLRIDPVDRFGIVEVAAVTLRDTATADVLWRADAQGGLDDMRIGGTALRLPHARLLRFLSYGDDPQVFLPHLTGTAFEGPLTLEVLLRFDPVPKNIEHALSGWNEMVVASKDVRSPEEVSQPLEPPISPELPCAPILDDQLTMAVYSAGESGYAEGRSTHVTYAPDRWAHLSIALHLGLGSKPLRIDPLATIGLIDIAALTLRSAISDEVLWRANGGGELETLRVSGSAARIPHSNLVRVLSYGDDPQIYLPPFPPGKFDGPLRLEIWLKAETGLDSIRKSITEFVSVSSQALAASTQTRGLLEQSNRAFAEKEAEIETLRAELNNTARERDQALATSTQTQGLLEQSNRAFAEKEAEIETLRVELDNAARDRDQALVASTQAQGLLEQSNRAFLEKEAELEAGLKKGLAQSKEVGQEKAALEEVNSSLRVDFNEARKQVALTESELSVRTTELGFTQRELEIARNKLEHRASELDQSRQESKQLRIQSEQLQRDLEFRSLHNDQLTREVSLLNRQLAVEYTAKIELMEEFTRAGEQLKSLRRDLALRKESQSPTRGGAIRKILGAPSIPKVPLTTDDGSQDEAGLPQYRFWLDFPVDPAPGDKIFFAGWVLPPPGEKILGVRALVHGETYVGQYGFERLDVAALFSDRPDATHTGFALGIPLSVGSHELALQALNAAGKWTLFCLHRHEVLPADAEQPVVDLTPEEQTAEGKPFDGWLENPGDETVIENGLLLVAGWLHFHTEQVTRLFAYIDDGPKITLTHSRTRNDVAEHLPLLPAAKHSGFDGYLPVASNDYGRIKLTVEALLSNGSTVICFQREVLTRLPNSDDFVSAISELSDEERYARWIDRNKLTPYLLQRMAQDGARLAGIGPKISLIVPTFNTPAPYLEALIDSVKNQLYPGWQLCLADDASTQPHVRAILERAAAADPRIQVAFRETNGHIVQASNSALALATGDYVGLLDHDDLLSVDALLHIAEAIVANRALNLLYTDEDKLSAEGKRFDPIFKGSFSPEMSLTHNYIQHFTVIRRSLVEEVGGFRQGFEGAQDLDLYLRVLERTSPEQVKHLPFVCYHWRCHPMSTASTGAQKNYVFDSAKASIAEALERRKIRALPFLPAWAKAANCCLYQLQWSSSLLEENPVTVIIPTKNRCDLLRKCLARLEQTVDTAHVTVLIVDDFSEEEATRSFLAQLGSESRLRCRVIQPRSPSTEFSFSQLINEGVAAAETSLVLLLNNDTEPLAPGWLEEMVGWMSISDVGAVGAKLLYPDNTIQHAGVLVGSHGGLAGHIFHRLPRDVIGFNFLTHAARNVSAVTAACLLTSKEVFDAVGGFDQEALAMEYNDVDFCLRLAKIGQRVVFTPQAELLHHCGQSRREGWRPAEHLTFLRRYRHMKDPYYNENLDLDRTPVTVNPDHFVHTKRVGDLKVLMVSHNLNLEGAPKVLFDHAAYFAREGGYRVTLISREDGPLRTKVEAAGVVVKVMKDALPLEGESDVAYTRRMRQIGMDLDIESFDLVICNTLTSFWGVVLAKACGLPVIWHVHESTTIEQFFYFASVSERLVEGCFSDADRVVFEASATRRLLSRYQKRDNFESIPGSIDIAAINRFREKHDQRSMKLKHGIDPEKTVVNLIGTTCPRKGQHVFIEAIRLLQENNPDDIGGLCFLMLGGRASPYLDLLYSQLREIDGTDTRIIEERHDIFDFYRLTDIFVCASFQESFPRVLLEAMAFKLPIVSTDVFGIPEMVEHEGEGLLVPAGDPFQLADAIGRLINAPKDREELGAKGHAKVTRVFNSEIQLRRQLDLTKEVVAQHL